MGLEVKIRQRDGTLRMGHLQPANSWSELCEIQARFVEGVYAGTDTVTPNCLACTVADETLPLLQCLSQLNRWGLYTHESQPGASDIPCFSPWYTKSNIDQRAYLLALATPEIFEKLMDVFEHDDHFELHVEGPEDDYGPSTPVCRPVNTEPLHGGVRFWTAAIDQIRRAYPDLKLPDGLRPFHILELKWGANTLWEKLVKVSLSSAREQSGGE